MRTFIISVVVLCLCFGGCILNTAITHCKINETLDILNSLSPDDIDNLTGSWENNSLLFTFTVKRTFLHDIADALQRLDAAAKHDDDYEFEAARSALIYKMKELYRSQSFDIRAIL